MFVMNNGAMLHTLHGTLKSGLNEVDAKTWDVMKKDVKKHLDSKRLVESAPAKTEAKAEPVAAKPEKNEKPK